MAAPVAAAPCKPPPTLLIRNVQLRPMGVQPQQLLRDQSVLVARGRIVRVAPQIRAPRGAQVIDGRGRFLLPGLIDAHVHVWDTPELSAYLAAGVTTVRNASGMPFHLDYARAIDAGCLEGPRLLTTGPILNGQGPNTQPNHQIVESAAQAVAAVRAQHRQGYRHLKLYSNLSRPAYLAIVAEARRLGMTLMGHTPEGPRAPGVPQRQDFDIPFDEVLAAGFVSIEHMESVVWHGLRDRLDEDAARALARRIARQGVALTPTLIAHHNLVRVARSRGAYLQRAGVEKLNPFVSELEQESYQQWSAAPPEGRSGYDAFYRRAVKIFHEEGVTLLAGTDAGIFTNVPGHADRGVAVAGRCRPEPAAGPADRHQRCGGAPGAGWRPHRRGRARRSAAARRRPGRGPGRPAAAGRPDGGGALVWAGGPGPAGAPGGHGLLRALEAPDPAGFEAAGVGAAMKKAPRPRGPLAARSPAGPPASSS
ncbi:MAG: hypothetical protein U1E77_19570 [Inhella sp.]